MNQNHLISSPSQMEVLRQKLRAVEDELRATSVSSVFAVGINPLDTLDDALRDPNSLQMATLAAGGAEAYRLTKELEEARAELAACSARAAEEIERRQKTAQIQATLWQAAHESANEARDEARAESAALREELEQVKV